MPRRTKSHSLPVRGTRPQTDVLFGQYGGAAQQHRAGHKTHKHRKHHKKKTALEAPGRFTLVTFHVRAELGHGEHICVVGNVAALGSNNMERAVELTTTPSTYPIFSSIRDIPIKTGTTVSYRLAIFSGGSLKRWISDADMPTAPIREQDDASEDAGDEEDDEEMEDVGTNGKSDNTTTLVNQQQEQLHHQPLPVAQGGRQGGASDVGGANQRKSESPRPHRYTVVIKHPTEMDISVTVQLADRPQHQTSTAAAAAPGVDEDVSREVKMRKSSSKQGLNQLQMAPRPPRAVPMDALHASRPRTVVVVVQYLPVKIRRIINEPEMANLSPDARIAQTWEVRWDDEAILSKDTAEYAASRKMRIQWLGQLPADAPAVSSIADRAVVTKLLEPFQCRPVFLDEKVAYNHNLFVTDTLFPLFHNVVQAFREFPTRWWAPARHQLAWRSYQNACQAYGTEVLALFNEGDMVWIHSLHFLLLPSYIARKTLSRARVGLFLHLPFPSSEIFRTLSMRGELLQAMLNADQIGFHTYEYARHFLACCRRILDQCSLNDTTVRRGHMHIENQGHTINIVIAHAGIEPAPIAATISENSQLQAQVNRIRARYPGRRIVLGIDSIQAFSGVDLKLLAFGKMLAENPRLLRRVVFVQILVSRPANGSNSSKTSREDAGGARKQAQRLRQDLLNLAAGVNARFSFDPTSTQRNNAHIGSSDGGGGRAAGRVLEVIEYPEAELTLPVRLAWLLAADVLVCVPIREGFNRIPLEFVAAQYRKRGGTAEQLAARKAREEQAKANRTSNPSPTLSGSSAPRSQQAASPRAPSLAEATTSTTWSTGPKKAENVPRTVATGAMVLSELCSCSRVLPGALTVNPASQEQMIEALLRAIELRPAERQRRNDVNAKWVNHWTTSRWATHVLTNLTEIEKKTRYQALGLGFSYRYMAESQEVRRLTAAEITPVWKMAKKKLVLLDLRGTLVDDRPRTGFSPGGAKPMVAPAAGHPRVVHRHSRNHRFRGSNHHHRHHSTLVSSSNDVTAPADEAEVAHLRPSEKILSQLEMLAKDPRTVVAVISGLEKEVMEALFSDTPHLHLLAEHGFHHRRPGRQVSHNYNRAFSVNGPAPAFNDNYAATGSAQAAAPPVGAQEARHSGRWRQQTSASACSWETIRLSLDNSWRPVAERIMNEYVLRTAGSYIREKASTLIWQYEETDSDFGALQAKDLQANLAQTLRNFNVDIRNGKGYVEIRPRGLTKGAAAMRLINEFQLQHGDLDAILCMGDDTSDETMFSALDHEDCPAAAGCAVFTCTVGRKVSAARYFVYDPSEVVEIVDSLSMVAIRGKRWSSAVNLAGMGDRLADRVVAESDGALPGPATNASLPRSRPAALAFNRLQGQASSPRGHSMGSMSSVLSAAFAHRPSASTKPLHSNAAVHSPRSAGAELRRPTTSADSSTRTPALSANLEGRSTGQNKETPTTSIDNGPKAAPSSRAVVSTDQGTEDVAFVNTTLQGGGGDRNSSGVVTTTTTVTFSSTITGDASPNSREALAAAAHAVASALAAAAAAVERGSKGTSSSEQSPPAIFEVDDANSLDGSGGSNISFGDGSSSEDEFADQGAVWA